MPEQSKLDPTALISIQLGSIERLSAFDFTKNFNTLSDKFEFIIRYTGDIEAIALEVGFDYIRLFNGFAIIYIPEENLDALIRNNKVLYIDKPKRVFYENIIREYNLSCMSFELEGPHTSYRLTGRGILMAVIDTGIDLRHPAFSDINVVAVWDQNRDGNPPFDYKIGSEYRFDEGVGADAIPVTDESGHGTSVTSIISGCAPDCDFIFVKLLSGVNNTSNTAAMLMAIDYVIRVSLLLNQPLVINLSYGNNYGDHDGNSTLEQYIDSCAALGKITFVCGMGNEGSTGKHAQLMTGTNLSWYKKEFIVNSFQTHFNLQIWKSFRDIIDVFITLPSGEEIGPFNSKGLVYDFLVDNMRIFVVVSRFSPFEEREQLFMSVIPLGTYVEEGIWSVKIRPRSVMDGRIDMWLPVEAGASSNIRFIDASVFTTYTIPASANSIISVAAYNPNSLSYTIFSGRGYTVSNLVKPDISAPGVDINVAVPGGGYADKSGTSFAAPFASAGAAMLMQWGITEGNDVFMFGDKVKNSMIRGALRLPGSGILPNEQLGFGALCVENSINLS